MHPQHLYGEYDPDIAVEQYLIGDTASSNAETPVALLTDFSPVFVHNAFVLFAAVLIVGFGAIAGFVWHRWEVTVIAPFLAFGIICFALRDADKETKN